MAKYDKLVNSNLINLQDVTVSNLSIQNRSDEKLWSLWICYAIFRVLDMLYIKT